MTVRADSVSDRAARVEAAEIDLRARAIQFGVTMDQVRLSAHQQLIRELVVSCHALLIYLERAMDETGNRYSDPVYGEPAAMQYAREVIARAKHALRSEQ